MANMNDYLDWRGDLPFSRDAFNMVDNIILSQLCYTDFEGVLERKEGPIFGFWREETESRNGKVFRDEGWNGKDAGDEGRNGRVAGIEGWNDNEAGEDSQGGKAVGDGSRIGKIAAADGWNEKEAGDEGRGGKSDGDGGRIGKITGADNWNGMGAGDEGRGGMEVGDEGWNEKEAGDESRGGMGAGDEGRKGIGAGDEGRDEAVTGYESGNEVEQAEIWELNEIYFSMHTDEEIRKRISFTRLAPFLLRKMAVGERFRNVVLSDYVNILSRDAAVQFSATTFHLGEAGIYIAFRGTDTSLAGWKEDCRLCLSGPTRGQRSAAEYLDYIARKYRGESPIMVGGHSKGGNFAVYAAAFCSKDTRDRISKIYSNDGPGFPDEVLSSEGYLEIQGRIMSIIPDESIVGIMFGQAVEPLVIRSSNRNSIMQHDLLSWEVMGCRIVEAEGRKSDSRLFERSFRDWLSGVNLRDREEFVNAVFSVLESTGAETFPQIAEKALRNLSRIGGSIRAMSREQQMKVMDILGKFLMAGGKVRMEEFLDWFQKVGLERQAEIQERQDGEGEEG